MKSQQPSRNKKYFFLLVVLILLTTFLLISYSENQKNKTENITNKIEYLEELEKEKQLNILFEQLILCESNNNELAINRKDSDGTASIGLLQWKPETFRRLAIKYGIIGEKADWNWTITLMFDRKVNKKIFSEVIKDKTENPYNLWGNCCIKVGCPEK